VAAVVASKVTIASFASRVISAALCTGLCLGARSVSAQTPVPRPAPRDSTAIDTLPKRPPRRLPNSIPDSLLRPPISPKSAFFRSLLLPGLGQTALRRNNAATFFSAAEIGTLYMVGKSRADLRRARALRGLDSVTVGEGAAAKRVPSVPEGLINARKLHLEDWIAVLLTTHLLAGADAYVAANLWDLPARVQIRETPAGIGIGAQIRW
jgi:hypothetical protein